MPKEYEGKKSRKRRPTEGKNWQIEASDRHQKGGVITTPCKKGANGQNPGRRRVKRRFNVSKFGGCQLGGARWLKKIDLKMRAIAEQHKKT